MVLRYNEVARQHVFIAGHFSVISEENLLYIFGTLGFSLFGCFLRRYQRVFAYIFQGIFRAVPDSVNLSVLIDVDNDFAGIAADKVFFVVGFPLVEGYVIELSAFNFVIDFFQVYPGIFKTQPAAVVVCYIACSFLCVFV